MAADSSHMYHLLTIILVVWASHFLTPTAVAAINSKCSFCLFASLFSPALRGFADSLAL